MLETIILVIAVITLAVVLLMLQKISKVDNREISRMLREDLTSLRNEINLTARQNREEVNASVRAWGDSLVKQMMEMTMLQKAQLDTLTASNEQRLDALRKTMEEKLAFLQHQLNTDALQNRTELGKALQSFEESFRISVNELNAAQRQKFGDLAEQLEKLVQSSEEKLEKMRGTLEGKLQELQADNTEKLEKIRATVEEKLHSTLEKRLGESFKQVSERLEQVHQGLGEMQNLATGVGDLKKALLNVKVRGTLGEIQLAGILDEILTPDQYAANVAVKPGRNERVEFAVKLPGKEEQVVWLPIDAKFPLEDYQRLLDAMKAETLLSLLALPGSWRSA